MYQCSNLLCNTALTRPSHCPKGIQQAGHSLLQERCYIQNRNHSHSHTLHGQLDYPFASNSRVQHRFLAVYISFRMSELLLDMPLQFDLPLPRQLYQIYHLDHCSRMQTVAPMASLSMSSHHVDDGIHVQSLRHRHRAHLVHPQPLHLHRHLLKTMLPLHSPIPYGRTLFRSKCQSCLQLFQTYAHCHSHPVLQHHPILQRDHS
mmetsp:Transcript_14180/g.20124  ORF Transcript_14180/g.20124 Transcript_14180/m.20124 type:complete len:204 (+) Transcript_14180:781-1392(+)